MRRLFLAALIFVAIGPVLGTRQVRPVVDTAPQDIAVHALGHPAGRAGALRFVRGWRLSSSNAMFGGFSSLAVTGPDRFQLIADNGYWARFAVLPGDRVADARIGKIPVPGGNVGKKSKSDVEALLFDPATDQSRVALEFVNEVWRLDPTLGRIESRAALPRPHWPKNSGPEAMARLPDGRIVIFSENADDDPRGCEALLFEGDPSVPGTRAQRFYYDAEGKGAVSDATTLPDGRILLVHRRVGFDPVFTTTVAIVDPADIRPGAVLRSRTIGRVPGALADNYEGAAVTTDGARIFLWLVSDNNFNRWQRSLLVQFELVGLPVRAPDSKKAAR
ncbi:esterase-like activity of phytase family protein [Sphingopyxis sp. Geo48]|uniref:esterase-like activity of phytase family protein n=1 Tax=Sphingopyxis sp. Geo48 TaxID=545241 RepID=UPI0024B80810|nr:esterase-like activity of phytase family protein [Sphingopyxis sp. Geo48]